MIFSHISSLTFFSFLLFPSFLILFLIHDTMLWSVPHNIFRILQVPVNFNEIEQVPAKLSGMQNFDLSRNPLKRRCSIFPTNVRKIYHFSEIVKINYLQNTPPPPPQKKKENSDRLHYTTRFFDAVKIASFAQDKKLGSFRL